jgi:antitoxin ParD1/3/4
MAVTRKTITLSDQQDLWVKGRIASGDYTNDSEYFRDLIRRDQEQNARILALKHAVQEGLQSGDSDRSVAQIMQDVERRLAANGRL